MKSNSCLNHMKKLIHRATIFMREKFVFNVQVKSISVLFTRNPYKEQL